jgi:hypothetical protein
VYETNTDRRDLYADAIGMDMLEGEGVDIVHNLEEPLDLIPFDHIDCCSVLEHCEKPWIVAENIQRLMAGTILLSVPFVWRVHGYPSDYFRFTIEGVRSLFPRVEWEKIGYASGGDWVKRPPSVNDETGIWFERCEVIGIGRCV